MAKTSLSLLQGYASSSSDDERDVTRGERLPLPLPDLPTYGISNAIARKHSGTDNNVDSTGKVRNFAHEAGNWATFVALEIDPEPLANFVDYLKEEFASLDMQTVDDTHISLTRVIVLRYHWINDFVRSVGNIISNTTRYKIFLNGLSVYTNDQKNRTFLGLDMSLGQIQTDEIVNRLDLLLDEYSLPKYYENRRYHVSLLWVSGDRLKETQSILDRAASQDPQNPMSSFACQVLDFHCLCKVGNKSFSFHFT